MGQPLAVPMDDRAIPRDEVHYRARAVGPDGKMLSLLIVNMSALGLMARCDHRLASGERLQVDLPGVGVRSAKVCWSLGGRIGCECEAPISLEAYLAVAVG